MIWGQPGALRILLYIFNFVLYLFVFFSAGKDCMHAMSACTDLHCYCLFSYTVQYFNNTEEEGLLNLVRQAAVDLIIGSASFQRKRPGRRC